MSEISYSEIQEITCSEAKTLITRKNTPGLKLDRFEQLRLEKYLFQIRLDISISKTKEENLWKVRNHK